MVDSEADVKVSGVFCKQSNSESLTRVDGKLANMASNRDTVLSDFLRFKIREWLEANPDREQRELAEIGGFPSDSGIAMVKRGQGVGAKTAPRFAKAFGFASVQAMVDAAYEWRKGLGESLERRLNDYGFAAAAQALGGLMPAPTNAELKAIAGSFVDARFDDRDPEYWLRVLAEELKRDRMREVASRVAKTNAAIADRQRERKEEASWREAASVKHRLGEALSEAHQRHQAVEADVEQLKKRRRVRAV